MNATFLHKLLRQRFYSEVRSCELNFSIFHDDFFAKKKSENQDIIWGDNLKEDGRIAK